MQDKKFDKDVDQMADFFQNLNDKSGELAPRDVKGKDYGWDGGVSSSQRCYELI
jgi:hypothetical protein